MTKKVRMYKRLLTQSQANACESAQRPVCHCRCGGVLHGISHQAFIQAQQELMSDGTELSLDDMKELAEVIANG
jgi:hypothetical protein